MGNQASEHSEALLPRKFQSSYSSAVESVQHERLCSLKSIASEYSALVARKGMPIFFKWSIADNPSESACWSAKVITQSGIQRQYYRVVNDQLHRERKTALCGVQYGHGLSQTG